MKAEHEAVNEADGAPDDSLFFVVSSYTPVPRFRSSLPCKPTAPQVSNFGSPLRSLHTPDAMLAVASSHPPPPDSLQHVQLPNRLILPFWLASRCLPPSLPPSIQIHRFTDCRTNLKLVMISPTCVSSPPLSCQFTTTVLTYQ